MLRIKGTAKQAGEKWTVNCDAINFGMTETSKQTAMDMLLRALCEAIGSEPELMWRDDEQFELVFNNDRPVIAFMLRAAREKSNLSLSGMCALLGTQSKTTVAQYETGKHSPGIAKLCELFNVLGYDVIVDVVNHQRNGTATKNEYKP